MHQELLNYIRNSLKQGFHRDEIRNALIRAGWRIDDIKDAFDFLKDADKAEVTIKKEIFSGKNAIAAIILVGLFIFSASAVFGGYYYWQTIPEKLINGIKENIDNLNSFNYAVAADFKNETKKTSVDAAFSGMFDFSEKDSLKEIIKKRDIFKGEYVGKEKIGGVETKHLKLVVNKENLYAALAEIAEKFSAEENKNMLIESITAISNVSGDVWIGREDLFIHKANFDIAARNGGIFNFQINFSDFNKYVEIKSPQKSESFLEFLEKSFFNGKYAKPDYANSASEGL